MSLHRNLILMCLEMGIVFLNERNFSCRSEEKNERLGSFRKLKETSFFKFERKNSKINNLFLLYFTSNFENQRNQFFEQLKKKNKMGRSLSRMMNKRNEKIRTCSSLTGLSRANYGNHFQLKGMKRNFMRISNVRR